MRGSGLRENSTLTGASYRIGASGKLFRSQSSSEESSIGTSESSSIAASSSSLSSSLGRFVPFTLVSVVSVDLASAIPGFEGSPFVGGFAAAVDAVGAENKDCRVSFAAAAASVGAFDGR